MRDEMDARIWVDHHEGFSERIDTLLGRFRDGFSRIPVWDGTIAHLLALIAASAISLVTFNAAGA